MTRKLLCVLVLLPLAFSLEEFQAKTVPEQKFSSENLPVIGPIMKKIASGAAQAALVAKQQLLEKTGACKPIKQATDCFVCSAEKVLGKKLSKSGCCMEDLAGDDCGKSMACMVTEMLMTSVESSTGIGSAKMAVNDGCPAVATAECEADEGHCKIDLIEKKFPSSKAKLGKLMGPLKDVAEGAKTLKAALDKAQTALGGLSGLENAVTPTMEDVATQAVEKIQAKIPKELLKGTGDAKEFEAKLMKFLGEELKNVIDAIIHPLCPKEEDTPCDKCAALLAKSMPKPAKAKKNGFQKIMDEIKDMCEKADCSSCTCKKKECKAPAKPPACTCPATKKKSKDSKLFLQEGIQEPAVTNFALLAFAGASLVTVFLVGGFMVRYRRSAGQLEVVYASPEQEMDEQEGDAPLE